MFSHNTKPVFWHLQVKGLREVPLHMENNVIIIDTDTYSQVHIITVYIFVAFVHESVDTRQLNYFVLYSWKFKCS